MNNNGRNNQDLKEEYYSSGSEIGFLRNYNSKGPSASELQQLNQRVIEETQIFKELKAIAGPTNANDWFCDVTKISFSLSKMREIAEANILGGKVQLDESTRNAMAL